MIIYPADSMADVYLVLRTYWFPVHLPPSTTAILSPPEFWVSKVLCQGSQARVAPECSVPAAASASGSDAHLPHFSVLLAPFTKQPGETSAHLPAY